MITLYQLLCYGNDDEEWIKLQLSDKEYTVNQLEEFIQQVHIEYYEEIYEIDMSSHESLLKSEYFSIIINRDDYSSTYKFFKAIIEKYNIFIDKLLMEDHIIKPN